MSDYFSMSKAKRDAATENPWHVFYVESCELNNPDREYIVHACNNLPKIEALLEDAISALVMIKHGSIVGYLTGEGCRFRAGCSLNKIEKELSALAGAELSKLCKEGE